MSGLLNTVSDFYFRAHRSRVFMVLVVLALAVCIGLIAAARPEAGLDLRIYDLNENTSITTSLDRYLNVRGRLVPEGRYQSTLSIGPLQLVGSRYIPIAVAGRDEPIFVLDENLPAPNAEGWVSFVGKLSATNDPVVSYFFEVERPTDVPLINRIARVALVAASLLLLTLLAGWWVRRANYALATRDPTNATPASPEWMWFGSLGARFQNAFVRQAPARLNTTLPDVTFESGSHEPWAVVVRRAQHARPFCVATAYGPLPAIRLVFEDERGLIRNGIIATNTTQARDTLLQKLTASHQQPATNH